MSAGVRLRKATTAVLPAATAAALIVNGIRLRRNARGIAALPPARDACDESRRFLTAIGVELDDDTRSAAHAFARANGVDVLDLVPADLPTEPALDLLRGVDPRTYRARRFAPGRGACHALLVSVDVLERARITRTDGWNSLELAELTVQLKLYASASTDIVVAPGLRALADERAVHAGLRRAAEIRTGGDALLIAGPPVAHAALVASAIINPVWGAIGVAAFTIAPHIALRGSVLTPRDRSPAATLARVWTRPAKWLRVITGPQPESAPDTVAASREVYAGDLAGGVDALLEPRRETCPWCGSADLFVRLVSPDHIQCKPGKFTLEQCVRCSHIFQNPRLTPAGLDFYYRDFYDGIGGKLIENTFEAGHRAYAARVAMVSARTTPRTWLDVGTGLAHFCAVARDMLPDTEFDGLDRGDNIAEAERRRWVRRGYRGMFPDLASELGGRYDVVSMHHYLEHTREPYDELDAAAKVLDAGGYLLIEVPDPDSPFGRLLGHWWMPWFQPQHQHLISCDNLVRALADRGLTVVDVHRSEANQPGDLALAVLLGINGFAHDRRMPWLPVEQERAHRTRIAARAAGVAVGLPIGGAAFLADLACDRYIRRTRRIGSIYRVLARKDS